MSIRIIESSSLYENSRPHVRSRHGYFPGVTLLPSGELLALFSLGEAFEAANCTSWIARSGDMGKTWTLQGALDPNPNRPRWFSDYLKLTFLRNGSIVALGYCFYRDDVDQPIGIAETGGLLAGDNLVSYSRDQGRSWSKPAIVARRWPELLEISGACIEAVDGSLFAVGATLPLPDGSSPSGQRGVLLRSDDGGRSWDDSVTYFQSANATVAPLEGRICQMADNRLAVIFWAYDRHTQKNLPNHIAISEDNGRSWPIVIDTGIMAQASYLLPLSDHLVLVAQAHRDTVDSGIYVRIANLRHNQWNVISEAAVYAGPPGTTAANDINLFANLKFGQPSLLRLPDGTILLTHWCIECGQGKIRTHRLSLTTD